MTVKIDRLKIRMPAGTTQNAQAFAQAVARKLAAETTGHEPRQADSLRLRVPSPKGDAAGAVARAIGRSVNGKGDS